MLKRATAVAALLAAPVAVLAGCDSNQTSSETTSSSTSAAAGEQAIKAELKAPDGRSVANATIDFANGYATVTVETVAAGILAPGSHGMHIHSVGKCEANSVAPTGGASGDFNSAGGHLQVGGRTEHPASGDLTPLNVRSDGSGKVVATTDAFKQEDLTGPEGSALIIHQGPDNFANIPQRYTHDGVPGPDAETLATGDSGGRVACAVLAAIRRAWTHRIAGRWARRMSMLPQQLTGILGWAESVINTLGEFGVGALVLLETVFSRIPSEVVLPLAGYLTRGRFWLVSHPRRLPRRSGYVRAGGRSRTRAGHPRALQGPAARPRGS